MASIRRPWASRSTGAERATAVIVTWFVEFGDEVTPASLLAEVASDKVDAQVQPEESGGASPCWWRRTRRFPRAQNS